MPTTLCLDSILVVPSISCLLCFFIPCYSRRPPHTTSDSPMAPQAPSIQSFFQPEVSSAQRPRKRKHNEANEDNNGDGFTSSELQSALHPTLHQWQPKGTYEEMDIGSLAPGPGPVALMGRVVNFYDQVMTSKMPQAAKGCLKVLVKDDTGTFAVGVPPRYRGSVTRHGKTRIDAASR